MSKKIRIPVNATLNNYAKEMRKNQTDEEKKLWYNHLKNITPKFHRQKIIGNYIVDFYCPKLKIIIEVDGIQHYEEEAAVYDEKRTKFLESKGFTVLRIDNSDVNRDYYNVLHIIDTHCKIKAKEMGEPLILPKEI